MTNPPSEVRVVGPLGDYASGFHQELVFNLGYTPLSAANQLRLMAHLSKWLAGEGLSPDSLTAERTKAFLEARRAQGYTCWLSQRGLVPLLGYLQGLGVVPLPPRSPVLTPLEELLHDYERYLLDERGLAVPTLRHLMTTARSFLSERWGMNDGEPGLEDLTAAEVAAFVAAECPKRGVGSAKILVTGLRSLLRFLHFEGRTSGELASVVPSVAGWRGGSLPKALPADQVRRLLEGCDRRSPVGLRDFAILMLLARLGLRAGEVASLELDDIDWRAGEVTIRGKARRDERLPLPVDVGEAIVGYLREGRPTSTDRGLFLRVKAPQGEMSDGAVKAVVRMACDRAGLPRIGAHRLRHSAATAMLGAGAGLAEVGQVLRHRELSTTAIYAKVDRTTLRGLALPWPGARP